MTHPLTSIIILTMNQVELTRACISSIQAHTPEPYELVIVDNGSTDDTRSYLESLDATVILNESNLGFGGGCNQGIAASQGERILFLNNDTIVTPGWLGAMHDALAAHPEAGLVGPRSNYVSGPQLVEDPAYDNETLDGLNNFSHSWCSTRRGSGVIVPRLVGFCLMARREVIERIGGFDIRFKMGNFEDDDLCVRARVAGWTCWMAHDSFVHHVGNRTFISAGIDYRASLHENWLRFARKWDLDASKTDGYDAHRIADREFVLHHDYAPIVGSLSRGEHITFEAVGDAWLFAANAHVPDQTAAHLERVIRALHHRRDISLVIRVDPTDGTTMPSLERIADSLDSSELCDIIIIEHDAVNDEALVRACEATICWGVQSMVMEGLARYAGRTPIHLNDLESVLIGRAAA